MVCGCVCVNKTLSLCCERVSTGIHTLLQRTQNEKQPRLWPVVSITRILSFVHDKRKSAKGAYSQSITVRREVLTIFGINCKNKKSDITMDHDVMFGPKKNRPGVVPSHTGKIFDTCAFAK